jgi:hypothetical protein
MRAIKNNSRITKLLPDIRRKLGERKFEQFEILVERVFNHISYPPHRRSMPVARFKIARLQSGLMQSERNSLKLAEREISSYLNSIGYRETFSILTAQEHCLIGSTPYLFKVKQPHTPLSLLNHHIGKIDKADKPLDIEKSLYQLGVRFNIFSDGPNGLLELVSTLPQGEELMLKGDGVKYAIRRENGKHDAFVVPFMGHNEVDVARLLCSCFPCYSTFYPLRFAPFGTKVYLSLELVDRTNGNTLRDPHPVCRERLDKLYANEANFMQEYHSIISEARENGRKSVNYPYRRV